MGDFDRFKDDYQTQLQGVVEFSGQDADFFAELKARHIVEAAERHLGSPKDLKVLDLGSGIGATDQFLAQRFSALHGVDVGEGVVEKAAKANPTVDYKVYDGKIVPFPDGTFDLVFAICVLHHVALADRDGLIREMKRVTKPGGLIMVFEHNPLNPVTVRVVNNCAFDADAILLRLGETRALFERGGLSFVERRYFLFLPWRGRLVQLLESVLRALPLGAQYFVAARV